MRARRPRRPAPPARLFFGVITGFDRLFAAARARIEERFGPLEEESPLLEFPATRTYSRIMGPDLRRRFYLLRQTWPQDGLAAVKSACIEMEEEIQELEPFPVPRAVNIDPGLLNDCRIVLATTKDHAHRLYRGQGIWEEVTLVFRAGRWRALPWTYPDFRSPRCAEFFTPIRERHLRSLREELIPETAPPPPPSPPPPPPP